MGSMGGWPVLLWVIVLGLAAIGGGLVARAQQPRWETLPAVHVAGVTLLGLFGWLALIELPGIVAGYWNLTAGLGDVDGLEDRQLFVIGQAVFVVASAVAVAGILRRERWGAVLGIGLAAAQLVWWASVLYQSLAQFGDSMSGETITDLLLSDIGGRIVPALLTIGLLAWPFRRTAEGALEPA